MRKVLLVCFVGLGLGTLCFGQNAPKWELFGGYSHSLADVSRNTLNLDGVHVSAAENMNNWFGGLLDFSAHLTSVNGKVVDNETIGFGPQVAYRKMPSLTPSAHVLVGVIRGSEGYLLNSVPGTHFGLIAGGALDYKIGRRVAFRVVQADWVRSKFQGLGRNNIRISTGLVLRID